MAQTKKPKAKPFKNWLYEDVAKEFGLKRLSSHVFLQELDQLIPDPLHIANNEVNRLKNILVEYIDTWNEDELKTMFINPFLSLINLVSPYYKVFVKRPLSISYANGTLITESDVDFVLGKGLQTMKKPFYLVNKYIAETPQRGKIIIQDIGHILIAMLAAQKQNQDNKPIYGIYVIGRLWFFVILDGSEYAVSKSYSAEDEEIFKIFAMLLHIKDVMEKLYQEI